MFVLRSVPFEPFFYLTPNWYNPNFQFIIQRTVIGLVLWTVYLAIQKINETKKAQNLVQLLFLPFINIKDNIQLRVCLNFFFLTTNILGT